MKKTFTVGAGYTFMATGLISPPILETMLALLILSLLSLSLLTLSLLSLLDIVVFIVVVTVTVIMIVIISIIIINNNNIIIILFIIIIIAIVSIIIIIINIIGILLLIALIIIIITANSQSVINTLRPRKNERRFADDIFKCIVLIETVRISIKIPLKFVPKGPINNNPALVQIMAWRRPGDKPLSGPMVVRLPTHICVTRPQ